MKKFLTAFSYIFHPLFIAVYAVLLFFVFGKQYFQYKEIYLILIQIIILTIFIPITFYYLLLSIGKVDSIMLASKKQRIYPLIIHCFLLFYIIKKIVVIGTFYELHFFFVGSLLSSVFALIAVFLDQKASLHMIGISALTIFVMGLNIHFQANFIATIMSLVMCCGFVATSRLEMKAHSYFELLLGTIIGIVPQLMLLYYWL